MFAMAVEGAEDECVGRRVVTHDECILVFFSGIVGRVALFGGSGVFFDGTAGGGRVEAGFGVVYVGDGEFGDAVDGVACSCDGQAAADFVEG